MTKAWGLLIIGILSGCSVRLVDDRIDPDNLAEALRQQKTALLMQMNYIAELQAKGILPKPEEKEK